MFFNNPNNRRTYKATMKQPFECRLRAFLAEIEVADRVSSRQEALDLVLKIWIATNLNYGTPESDLLALRRMRLCAEDGWRDLEKDPCYLDSPERSGLRLHLHHDGTIVLQNNSDHTARIVFTKLGASALHLNA